jgi:hypothetical protein
MTGARSWLGAPRQSSLAVLAVALGWQYLVWRRRSCLCAPEELAGTCRQWQQSALPAAIRAANLHDTQPWLFHIDENRDEPVCQPGRNLASFGPFRREMHLGPGAAIENLMPAAYPGIFGGYQSIGWEANSCSCQSSDGRRPDNTPNKFLLCAVRCVT